MRYAVMAAALVLMAGMLGGCADAPAASQPSEEPGAVTIRVGIWPSGSDPSAVAVWKEYEQEMREKYPYITLEPEPISYSFESFIPMAVSGLLPDIFQTYFTEPQRLIANGFVADITAYAQEYGFLTGQRADILEVAARDGRQYGIARDAYGLSLYLNMNLFRQAGLVDEEGLPLYPETFDELTETARLIRKRTGRAGFMMPSKDGVGGWHFCNIAWAFGAQLQYQDEQGHWRSGIDSPQTAAALQYIRDLKWEEDVLLEGEHLGWGDWIANFATDQVAMVLAAPDAMRSLVSNFSMSKDAIAIAPVPAGPGGQYTLMGGTLYMFSANSAPEQLDACFKLMDVIGLTPHVTDNMLAAVRRELASQVEQDLPVGPRTINVWVDTWRVTAEQALYDEHTNVDMRLFEPYYEMLDSTLCTEYSRSCQEMYRTLDGCIRAVLGDPDADIAALLAAASEEYEKFYLGDVD